MAHVKTCIVHTLPHVLVTRRVCAQQGFCRALQAGKAVVIYLSSESIFDSSWAVCVTGCLICACACCAFFRA